jgi:hypothetical protein
VLAVLAVQAEVEQVVIIPFFLALHQQAVDLALRVVILLLMEVQAAVAAALFYFQLVLHILSRVLLLQVSAVQVTRQMYPHPKEIMALPVAQIILLKP